MTRLAILRCLTVSVLCALFYLGSCTPEEKPNCQEQGNCSEATEPNGDGGTTPFDNAISDPASVRWNKVKVDTKADLWGVHMASERHAWVVGANGTILFSDDAGKTWTAQSSGVTETLRGVHFINETHGWVVGDDGTCLSTTDGGKTWKKLPSPVSDTLWAVQFLDEKVGFAVGDGFSLLRTSNGGELWNPTSIRLEFDLRQLHFFDAKSGFIVGSNGSILYTSNGALTVTTEATGIDKTLHGLSFVGGASADKATGWAVGADGQVLTKEGANNWTKVSALNGKVDAHIAAVWFATQERGWFIGASGLIWGTSDSGKTWNNEARMAYPDLHAIAGTSQYAGLIVGSGGTILRLEEIKDECKDGESRDCYTGPSGTKGVGRCVGGKQTCKSGIWGVCTGEVTPAGSEVCFNDKDDNCNGKSEKEDKCPDCKENDSRDCYTGPKGTQDVGACVQGVQYCRNNKWDACEDQVEPADESCNGIDDDCDGKVDNDPKDPPKCDLPIGVCASATKICRDGAWQPCEASQFGSDYQKDEDKCDDKDNDCDGTIDENCACTNDGETRDCYGGVPGTDGKGTCTKGKQTCSGGTWTTCVGEVLPAKEICEDQKDNDCDGEVDEKTQYALACNGTWSYASVPHAGALAPTDAITVEGWFNIDALPSGRSLGAALISKSEGGGYALLITNSFRRRNIVFRVWPKDGKDWVAASVSTRDIIKTKTWQHIAGTYNGEYVRVWVDGKKVAETPLRLAIEYNKTVDLYFGAEAGEGGVDKRFPGHLSGQIAQVRVSNKSLYDADFTPDCVLGKTAETVGLWLMEEGAGKVINDEMGQHHGAWNGPRWDEAPRCPGFTAGGGCQKASP